VDKPGVHCHFITWSPDGRFLYFVRGLPNYETDIWRLRVTGGEPERITFHESKVTSPAFLNDRTLIYCATAEDGSGPWLYGMDLERRAARRLSIGLEQYISVAAASDGRRLAAAVSNPSANLWTVPISPQVADEAAVSRYAVPSVRAAVPVFGPDYLLYLSSKGGAEGI
jgi:dipeptidyl aminopeptidase/acylaminoacyl peptidase